MSEHEVLAKYSSDRLRRCSLDRTAKKAHLRSAYRIEDERAEKILDEMYGKESVRPVTLIKVAS